MKSRSVIVACWIQVVIAAALVVLTFYSSLTRPTTQFEYSRANGLIGDVTPGGTAERAGLRRGDRVISSNGVRVGRGAGALFFARAGDVIDVVTQRGTFKVTLVPQERARRESLRSGWSRALGAIGGYSIFPLDVWMLSLGVLLLYLRPEDRDARLSSLTLIYWAGGHVLCDTAGMGALLDGLPIATRAAIYIVDDFFVAAFFAACLNFAIVFPSRGGRRVSRLGVVLATLAPIPIFIEELILTLRRLTPGPS